jgi:hypothetical protein
MRRRSITLALVVCAALPLAARGGPITPGPAAVLFIATNGGG